MPCFKGLAVSIHTPDGPISEYSIQRQSRASRIASFIPVPPAKLPASNAGKPEQSTFAISITLLNSGQDVPYSAPKPTLENMSPKSKVVGGLPGQTSERGQYSNMVAPYQPLTNSPNETIAAYIYFDGRQKEEVATLLRRGEETWVNSRWVSVPESEGGGLAEREFLFREVGLERWLNGLDLEGKDAVAKIERRKQKIEKRRQKRSSIGDMEMDGKAKEGKGSCDMAMMTSRRWRVSQTMMYLSLIRMMTLSPSLPDRLKWHSIAYWPPERSNGENIHRSSTHTMTTRPDRMAGKEVPTSIIPRALRNRSH